MILKKIQKYSWFDHEKKKKKNLLWWPKFQEPIRIKFHLQRIVQKYRKILFFILGNSEVIS